MNDDARQTGLESARKRVSLLRRIPFTIPHLLSSQTCCRTSEGLGRRGDRCLRYPGITPVVLLRCVVRWRLFVVGRCVRKWSSPGSEYVELLVSILDSPPCTILLWSFLSVRSRYLLDYLFTMIDDATVCNPLSTYTCPDIYSPSYTPVC